MARISKYRFDQEVTSSDFVIGSDGSTRKTRNYLLSDLTDFFGKQDAIQGNKFVYIYKQTKNYVDLLKGEISFNNKSEVDTTFSGIDTIYINRNNLSNNDIFAYLEELRTNDGVMYVFNGSNSTQFGIYRIQTINILSGDVIEMNVDVLSSNGTITLDDTAVISVLYGENDKTHIHTQISASSSWTVAHGLAKFPSVTVVDDGDNVIYGDVAYTDQNELTINFSSSVSGKAYIN
jgi:hypothetical protein